MFPYQYLQSGSFYSCYSVGLGRFPTHTDHFGSDFRILLIGAIFIALLALLDMIRFVAISYTLQVVTPPL